MGQDGTPKAMWMFALGEQGPNLVLAVDFGQSARDESQLLLHTSWSRHILRSRIGILRSAGLSKSEHFSATLSRETAFEKKKMLRNNSNDTKGRDLDNCRRSS
jgi:hypothetical protein